MKILISALLIISAFFAITCSKAEINLYTEQHGWYPFAKYEQWHKKWIKGNPAILYRKTVICTTLKAAKNYYNNIVAQNYKYPYNHNYCRKLDQWVQASLEKSYYDTRIIKVWIWNPHQVYNKDKNNIRIYGDEGYVAVWSIHLRSQMKKQFIK